MVFGEGKIITSEKVEGVSIKLNEDGKGGRAELNGTELFSFDFKVGEKTSNYLLDNLMNVAEAYAVENLDAEYVAQKILRQEVENNPDGYKMYFDYSEQIEPSTFAEIFHEYQDKFHEYKAQFEKSGHSEFKTFDDFLQYHNFTTFEAFLQEQLWKRYYQWSELDVIENNFKYNRTEDELKKVEEYLKATGMSLDEALYNEGFAGVQFDVKDVVGSYKINVMLATPSEENHNMGTIPEMFGCDSGTLFSLSADEQNKHFDNALTYLVYQQGHDLVELAEAYYSETPSDNEFIQSVADDLNNFPGYGAAELTVLVQLNNLEALEMLAKGEGNITFSPDTTIGIYNEWDGTGSSLEIQLEKPFTIPANMVKNVQIEGQKYDYVRGYTVDDTYGLVGSCWKDTMSIAEESVQIDEIAKARQADVPNAVKAIKKFADFESSKCSWLDYLQK